MMDQDWDYSLVVAVVVVVVCSNFIEEGTRYRFWWCVTRVSANRPIKANRKLTFQHFENARYAINGELNNCDGDGDGGTLGLVESPNGEAVGNW